MLYLSTQEIFITATHRIAIYVIYSWEMQKIRNLLMGMEQV